MQGGGKNLLLASPYNLSDDGNGDSEGSQSERFEFGARVPG